MSRCHILLAFVGSVVIMNVPQVLGQGIPGGINREVIELKGALEGIQGNFLRVRSDDGKVFTVKAPDELEAVRYTGTGVMGMLQPGLFVRYEGMYNAMGQSAAPVTSLEVFTPYKPRHATPEILAQMMPGVYPTGGVAGGGEGLFEEGKSKKPRGANQGAMNYKVIGRIAGASKKGVNISAGQMMLLTDISPEVQITVTAVGGNLAVPGDTVHVSGFVFPPKDTEVLAERIRITGVAPLGVVPEKPKPGSKKKPSPEKGDAGGAAAEEGKKPAAEAKAE